MRERTCESDNGNRRECVKCGEWISTSNFARHVRGCSASGGSDGGAKERERGKRGCGPGGGCLIAHCVEGRCSAPPW